MHTVELSALVPLLPVATAVIVASVFPAPNALTGTRNAADESCWLITNTSPISGSLARVVNDSVAVALPPEDAVATAVAVYSV